jgi:hypothetical protein
MATVRNEHLRALRVLARHPNGCTEATLLKLDFTVGQLSYLVYAGLAKLRRPGATTMAFRVKITTAGRSDRGVIAAGLGPRPSMRCARRRPS